VKSSEYAAQIAGVIWPEAPGTYTLTRPLVRPIASLTRTRKGLLVSSSTADFEFWPGSRLMSASYAITGGIVGAGPTVTVVEGKGPMVPAGATSPASSGASPASSAPTSLTAQA
jgi:hypothetical protein